MRWQGRRQSDNVEDQRNNSGGGIPKGRVYGGIGCGGIILIALIVILGGNPQGLIEGMNSQPAQTTQVEKSSNPYDEQSDQLASFVRVVLADTEDVWSKLFIEQIGERYQPPTMVLFSDKVRSACGFASAASGPFYCPRDQKLYIDLSFYGDMKNKFGASGDFAMAYVVAHEVGHHVQNLLGITDQVQSQRGKISQTEYNDLSVRLELQADFLAGVWAHHDHKMHNILEKGDYEEAMNAANAIGDDRIQKRTQGYIVPDSFTHGSSAQRKYWFDLGIRSGDLSKGDTFKARNI